MVKLIQDRIEHLKEICRKNEVEELYVFGSVLTEDFSDQSDLDFAYILKEDLSPIEYGEAFFSLLEDLESLFNRKVDLVSYRRVKNPIFKEEIDRTKKSLYAAA
jgi:predicted nucleotidyltransferase